jgi:hypothetical protein
MLKGTQSQVTAAELEMYQINSVIPVSFEITTKYQPGRTMSGHYSSASHREGPGFNIKAAHVVFVVNNWSWIGYFFKIRRFSVNHKSTNAPHPFTLQLLDRQ